MSTYVYRIVCMYVYKYIMYACSNMSMGLRVFFAVLAAPLDPQLIFVAIYRLIGIPTTSEPRSLLTGFHVGRQRTRIPGRSFCSGGHLNRISTVSVILNGFTPQEPLLYWSQTYAEPMPHGTLIALS